MLLETGEQGWPFAGLGRGQHAVNPGSTCEVCGPGQVTSPLWAASCSHMQNKDIKSHLIELSWRLNEFIHENHFEECPAPSKLNTCCFHHCLDPLCRSWAAPNDHPLSGLSRQEGPSSTGMVAGAELRCPQSFPFILLDSSSAKHLLRGWARLLRFWAGSLPPIPDLSFPGRDSIMERIALG